MRDFIVYFQFNITNLDFFSSILSLQWIFAYLEEEELEDSMAYVIGECKALERVRGVEVYHLPPPHFHSFWPSLYQYLFRPKGFC